VKPWRQDVIVSALDAIEDLGHWQVISGPVHVVVEFFLPRPKGQPKTRRTVPTTTPDLDKLVRATGDALKTAGGNQAQAARLLQTTERILRYKIRRLGIAAVRPA